MGTAGCSAALSGPQSTRGARPPRNTADVAVFHLGVSQLVPPLTVVWKTNSTAQHRTGVL